MVRFEAAFQSLKNLISGFNVWLIYIHFLEPPRERSVFFKNTAILLVSRGANAAHLPCSKSRLEQVGGVHYPTGRRACADDHVNLVYKEYRLLVVTQFVEQRFETLLKIPSILCARQ